MTDYPIIRYFYKFKRCESEICAAFTASLLVSPLVSIIDKTMVDKITGVRSMTRALLTACHSMVFKPSKFFFGTTYLCTVAVYFGTYAVANLSDVFLDFSNIEDMETRKSVKVACATTANISLLSWRDSILAQSLSQVPKAVPLLTRSCFAVRDGATMFATFYLSPFVSHSICKNSNLTEDTVNLASALVVPTMVQLVTAPIHIFAFDYYQQPNSTSRLATIVNEMPMVCVARCLRIIPAFGIGSFTNQKLRDHWKVCDHGISSKKIK